MRKGLTLVETLVVIAILAVLASLLIPAVLSTIETSRMVQCKGRLKQIALALNNYHATFEAFPSASGMPNYATPSRPVQILTFKQFGFLPKILGYIEHEKLYNSINFQTSCYDFYQYNLDPAGVSQNATSFSSSIGLFLCGSDAAPGSRGWSGGSSYRANLGTHAWDALNPNKQDGAILSYRSNTYARISDGCSNTVLLSERLLGALGGTAAQPGSHVIRLVSEGSGDLAADSVIRKCSARAQQTVPGFAESGLSWAVGTLGHTTYNHIMRPNARQSDCEPMSSNPMIAMITARSNHRACVNCALADGAVITVSDQVVLPVWRALGTSAGGEAVDVGGW